MKWFQKNFKTLIYISFLVPILTVAFVSISHVTKWYGISNPLSWAVYLSVGIEIAALSALAAISANMGKKVYFPFGIVTLIQFIGNVYFAYQFIDVNSKSFQEWVSLVDPIVSFLGVEEGNFQSHKRFLSFFAGGLLPLISLSFLHMLVKFEEEEKKKISNNIQKSESENLVDVIKSDKIEESSELKLETEITSITEEQENKNNLEKTEILEFNQITDQELINNLEIPTEESKKRKTLTYQKRDANN